MMCRFAGGACAAAAVALGMAVFSQTTVSAQAGNPAAQERTPPAQPSAASAQQVTVTGCVQREADFRKARDAGRGGVAGTGVGAGNEFILADASMSSTAGATSTRGAGAPGPAATTGGSDAFELTGRDESKAEQYVGKRVEISGMVKAAETAGGRPTGGPTAGKPPEGVDVAGRDLQLRELEISGIKEVPGTCAK
jgi:hypothetical protein